MGKKLFIGLGVGILVIAIIAGGFTSFVLLGKERTKNQIIETVNLDHAKDGTYKGTYHAFRWTNTVQVTIFKHKISSIKIIKPQVFAKEETLEKLTDEFLSDQTANVDVISAATADSKAYMKAVENALKLAAKTEQ